MAANGSHAPSAREWTNAPRLPALKGSLAAASRKSAWRKLLHAIEPWYDFGQIHVERLDREDIRSNGEGPVRYFELQWLGVHFAVQIGRVPERDQ